MSFKVPEHREPKAWFCSNNIILITKRMSSGFIYTNLYISKSVSFFQCNNGILYLFKKIKNKKRLGFLCRVTLQLFSGVTLDRDERLSKSLHLLLKSKLFDSLLDLTPKNVIKRLSYHQQSLILREPSLITLFMVWIGMKRRHDELYLNDLAYPSSMSICPVCGSSIPKDNIDLHVQQHFIQPQPSTSTITTNYCDLEGKTRFTSRFNNFSLITAKEYCVQILENPELVAKIVLIFVLNLFWLFFDSSWIFWRRWF